MQNDNVNKPDTVLLANLLPDGLVVNRKWLKEKGFERTAVDYFVRSGKLVSVGHGVYRRPGPPLKWEHLVYSLQESGCPAYVGGRSALDLQGMAHYLPLGGMRRVELYGVSSLPGWMNSPEWPVTFRACGTGGFDPLPDDALTTIPFGHWDWPVKYATVELALFELLADLRDEAGFDFADKYFETAGVLRPKLLNSLLKTCRQVKTKRLFLWFAERHRHQWLKMIDKTSANLGSGKRMIIKGGALDKTYAITVPRSMSGDSNEQGFY